VITTHPNTENYRPQHNSGPNTISPNQREKSRLGRPDPGNHHPKSPHLVTTAHHVCSYRLGVQYEIRVAGRLENRWEAWFDGLSITSAADGTTYLRGAVADQAALHGLLQALRDLGIPLISLMPTDTACERNRSCPHQ
ncbi:hypothetical protein ACWDTI_10675, partial [Gordonia sp. NPDC003424]